MHKKQESPPLRLPSQANWIIHNELKNTNTNEPYIGAEYPLYSDVGVVGEISEGLGPYMILNALPSKQGNEADISIILRAFIHQDAHQYARNPLKTDNRRFHGGDFEEEIASLISLSLGIRLKAAEANRYFYTNDPLGRFRAHKFNPTPSLSINPKNPMIPMPETVDMTEAAPFLATIPNLKPKVYIELVRAARTYQDALWISESDPHLAWLLFISSLEIAANADFTASYSALENFKALKPSLALTIQEAGGEQLLAFIAEEFNGIFGSTRKFLLFCEKYMPPAPKIRPLNENRISWTWTDIQPVLNKVYSLRSHALHAGIPFPAPMCRAPRIGFQDKYPAEKAITSLAEGTMNSNWVPKDAPIALHTFQYFARGALLNWWQMLATDC
ncbi:hypothetical protein N5I28_02060 [Pseudomonas mosselii]|uniref:hypothetical protein n=1 Tax=Pseudomonas mosselii TaxID=78327 RepID=UPI00244D2D23|nr:hypothetical protein [Pseudomonas mosselii]MDH1508540.1 hypothetical protein [Pseudomonas mosselii]